MGFFLYLCSRKGSRNRTNEVKCYHIILYNRRRNLSDELQGDRVAVLFRELEIGEWRLDIGGTADREQ